MTQVPPTPDAQQPITGTQAGPQHAPMGTPVGYVTQRDQGDATGGIIPYKNVPALVAYYCGVFSIFPFFPIGIIAVILGIVGLRAHRRNPAVRGSVHAWVGIVAGGLFGLLWLALTVLFIAVAVSAP